jgi:branched-chain amino acid transport system substrate-binding protein
MTRSLQRALVRLCLCTAISAATAALAQQAPAPLRIGVLDDMNSVFSDSSGRGNVVAAQLAVEDFGATVLGRRIEIVSADHQNKPDLGSNLARQWFDVGGVSAIVGLGNSAVALAVSNLGWQQNKVVLASGAIASALTGKSCNANTVQWTVDSWSLANTVASSIVKSGGDSWFFLTVDYAFGLAVESDTSRLVKAVGGKVVGAVRHPLNSSDFSSFLLQAQSSRAKVIALANGGSDMANAVKQAQEFNITKAGQRLVGLVVTIDEIHALGLASAAGLQHATPFYWDFNDGTRAFARRFAARMNGKMPSMMQAGAYSGVLHYLKSLQAAGVDDGAKVVTKMKDLPTEDAAFGRGRVRADGRKIHDMYLYEVKSVSESRGPWDYARLVATVPGDEAIRPLNEGECPIVATVR